MTHAQLVAAAARWLRVRCPVVITEMSSGAGEEPDAIGWSSRGSFLIECKVSRSDLRAEALKPHRRRGTHFADGERWSGMGNYRYLLTPPGLLSSYADPLRPQGWGLMEAVSERRVRLITPAEHRECDYRDERLLLLSCIRRLGVQSAGGVSVKVYTMQTKCRATLAVKPQSQPPEVHAP